MKKILLASVSAFALAGTAFGADMTAPAFKAPPLPVANWAGFYLGIDGGVARHDAEFNDLGGFFGGGSNNTSKTGGVFGGYAGYNFQDRSFVYGVEADINWVGAKATEAWGGSSTFNSTGLQSQNVPWVATFRGRMGIDFESTLFYLTGGLAAGKVENSFNAFCPPAPGSFCIAGLPGEMFGGFSNSTTRLGWTAGAGIEHMFSSHWTVRGEFRYVDLGRTSVACTPALLNGCGGVGTSYRGEFSNTLMNGLVGVGYKF
jgi:outer membrane immunogenic protein